MWYLSFYFNFSACLLNFCRQSSTVILGGDFLNGRYFNCSLIFIFWSIFALILLFYLAFSHSLLFLRNYSHLTYFSYRLRDLLGFIWSISVFIRPYTLSIIIIYFFWIYPDKFFIIGYFFKYFGFIDSYFLFGVIFFFIFDFYS